MAEQKSADRKTEEAYGGQKEGRGDQGAKPVHSPVPERRKGTNPSAPNDVIATPGSTVSDSR